MTSRTLLVLASALPVVVRIDAAKRRRMFMRDALGFLVYLFGGLLPFAKRPKNPQQFIVKNNEIYEYDPESKHYYPWKSSVPKR